MSIEFKDLFPSINKTSATGQLRTRAADFKVIEHHDINFTEKGEHLWLNIEKTHSNTAWVATQLASACKVPARQVGFAGLKDRHAITQQWFSVQLPKISEIRTIETKLPNEISILEHHWHQSKIKTGQLSHNEFNLIIRRVDGDCQGIEQNLQWVKLNGVPNYFGPQRFGHQMNNIQQVKDWFADRIRVNNKKLRGVLISTARSHIFNLIVAHRIQNNLWNRVISGDIVQLNNTHSWFAANQATMDELETRLRSFDLHITAALWGEDAVQSTLECANLETQIAHTQAEYQTGFTKHRVKQDRRAMRILPTNLSHQWKGDDLHINFKLQPGAYATCLLREILDCKDQNSQQPSD